ncbi:MAG TPA: cysteine dioxygenase family protein [Acidimicrobiales bacterium]
MITATPVGRRHPVVGVRRCAPRLASPAPAELLAVAEGLVDRARRWSGTVGITTRSWSLLAASDTFEAWVIGWPPGGTIALHDHGHSAAAVVVAAGELVETNVAPRSDGAVTTVTRRMPTGSSWKMASRHVHDIVNDGPTPAVSVHVYAPRLTSMTNYRLVDGVLQPEKTVHYRLGDVVA